MTATRKLVRIWSVAPGLGLVILLLGAAEGRGDWIVLRGGAQIRGKVLPEPSQRDRIAVVPERGKSLLTFHKPQVLKVVADPSPLDDYVAKRLGADGSAQAQYELGLWCEQNKLPDLAEFHYAAAVQADKSFAPAHQKLGHARLGDRWLDANATREAQGLVLYKGKWISQQERDRREERAATTAEQASWVRRIRLLRQAIALGPDDRRREAELQLMEIREPIAVSPLVRVLGEDTPQFRTLLDHVLALIPGPEAAEALVLRLLAEADPDVRHVTMDELGRRPEPSIIPQLVQALRSTDSVVVNRAAWALGNLRAVRAVPKLVAALFTTQYQVMLVPSGGGGGSAPDSGFGSVAPAPTPGVPLPAVPIAYNGSTIAYLTPPAMAPGAVAFGATSAPAYAGSPALSTLGSIGYTPGTGGGLSASRGPTPRLVPVTTQNVEVLSTLIKLTGRDFGFDVGAWRRWISTSFEPEPEPVRRVPEP